MKLLTFIGLLLSSFQLCSQNSISLNEVEIIGATNISKFHLNYPKIADAPPLKSDSVDLNNTNYLLNIPAHHFNALNQLFLHDFLELIKADVYPFIQVYIPKVAIDSLQNQQKKVKLVVQIAIAGVLNNSKIEYQLAAKTDCLRCFKGHTTIRLSDFNIVAPQKVFGIIKVRDELSINFSINY